MRSKHFVTELVRMASGQEVRPEPRACQLWICVEGCANIGESPCQQGEVWLLPESSGQPAIRAEGEAKFLRTWVP